MNNIYHNLKFVAMKRSFISALLLSSALLAPTFVSAEPVAEPAPEPIAEPAPEAVATPAPQAGSQSNWEKVISKLPKLSGYLQSGWNYTKTGDVSANSFQAKRLRLIMDGHVGEKVDFRLQIEAFNGIAGSTNGNGQKNLQVMDAFATWKIVPEFKVRVGQFYTPLGYENYDISPATLETVDFSNIVYRMACRNPFQYNVVDYGRDLGIMFMGDAFDSGKGFSYLHYDLAFTNGSIPCRDDNNKAKDIYASLTIRPTKYFNIKGTFNWGKYTTTDIAGGDGVNSPRKDNPMTRFVVGAWYNDPNGLTLRGEFGAMKSKLPERWTGTGKSENIVNEYGAYVLAGYHFGKFLPLVRWDMYKDDCVYWSANNYQRIMLGLTYQVFKNFKIQANYGHFMYTDNAAANLGYDKSEQVQIMAMFNF